MKSKKPAKPSERRSANRYAVSMRMEIWPESEQRGSSAKAARTRDISMRGIYFFCDAEHCVGTRVNFAVVFRHQLTRIEEDLISGLGRIVRCEGGLAAGEAQFGVAIKIETTHHVYEG